MRSFLVIVFILCFLTTILWGCAPSLRTQLFLAQARAALPQIRIVPQEVQPTEFIASSIQQEFANFIAQQQAATDQDAATPEAEQTGSCLSNSQLVARTNVWRCTQDDAQHTLYDPCFAEPDNQRVICAALDRPHLFRMRLTSPLPILGLNPSAQPLHLEAINNVAFSGLDLSVQTIQLTNGEYHSPAQGDDSFLIQLGELQPMGDLDRDGDADAAAILIVNRPAANQTSYYLAVIDNQEGVPVNLTTIKLGTEIRIDNLAIQEGQIVVNIRRHREQDPPCCPSLAETRYFNVVNRQLISQVNGWRIELNNGVQCMLEAETTLTVNQERATYRCADGAWLLGDLRPGTVWIARRALVAIQNQQASIEDLGMMPVRRIWQ